MQILKKIPLIIKVRIITTILLLVTTSMTFAQLAAAEYEIKNIKQNSRFSDYGVSYFGANRAFFASNRLDANSLKSRAKRRRGVDDIPKYDLFKAFVNNKGELNYEEKVLDNSITKYNESNVSFTPDLKYVYFTQNNIKKNKYVKDDSDWINLNIYRARVKTNGEWAEITRLPFNADNYNCAHPSVSEDGQILFFTSDMPGTHGGSDIFWVQIFSNTKYGEPQNLGENVNSTSRETFPYVDKNILYFSSNRVGSMGGLDVFMVALDQPNATPVNLGTPVNSVHDDFCFVIDRKNKRGFFSSNRPNGKGQDDIYSFIQTTEIQECKQNITGVVRDRNTDAIISGAVVKLFSHENIRLGVIPVEEDGAFSFDLACRDNYRIEASHTGYHSTFQQIGFTKGVFTQNITLFLEKDATSKPKEVVVKTEVKEKPKETVVEEIKEEIVEKEIKEETKDFIYVDGKEILNLPPIYFDLNQHYLTKHAIHILGKAIEILEKHPNVKIEFGAHTDCRASDSYNLHLSNLRAKEVVKHILQNSIITPDRISGRGYGESRPVNKCIDGVKCTEPEHLLNRRTEFVIINN